MSKRRPTLFIASLTLLLTLILPALSLASTPPPPTSQPALTDATPYTPIGARASPVTIPASTWFTQTVDFTGTLAEYVSLQLAPGDLPRIAYYDRTNGDLKYAYYDGTAWHVEVADQTAGADVGRHCSLVLHSVTQEPYISYYDATNGNLKLASRSTGGIWSIETIDGTTTNVGQYTALALNVSTEKSDQPLYTTIPYISYYDYTSKNLKFAEFLDGGPGGNCGPSGTDWLCTTVDSIEDVGQYTSLQLDLDGNPHVSYYYYQLSSGQGKLKYAYRPLSQPWAIEFADPGGAGIRTGYYTSLALDSSNYPHIAYGQVLPTTVVRYAYKDAGGWHRITPGSTGTAGYTSLALTTAGYARISYSRYAPAPQQLGYLSHYPDGTWTREIIESNDGEQQPGATALKLHPNGFGRIAYQWTIMVNTDINLRYANQCMQTTAAATPTTACTGETITFTSTVTATTPVTYLWAFGDGITSTLANPTHAYASGGHYTTTFTATASCGTTALDLGLTIFSSPAANFTFAPPLVCAALTTVQFTNTTVGSPTLSYLWDFGNNFTSTLANPTHTFSLVDRYSVTLTATNSCGSDRATQQIQAHSAPDPIIPTWAPTLPEVGHPATFTAELSSTLPIDLYLWEFGDGDMTSGPIVTHTYNSTGTKTLRLTASNACGVNFAEDNLTVVCYPETDLDFTWYPVTPTLEAPIVFTASTPNGTTPFTYAWDFGDGQTGAGSPSQHTYTATGTYTIVLTVTNFCSTAVSTHVLEVVAFPHADFLTSTPLCVATAATFTNTTSGVPPLTYQWAFGDGGTSTATNPIHTYADPGTFTTTLTATNPYGDDSARHNFAVLDPAHNPLITYYPGTPAPSETITFTATAAGTAPTYAWDFGDGAHGAGAYLTHTYAMTGTYLTTLTASNSCAQVTTTVELTVSYCQAPAGLDLEYTPQPPRPGRTLFFTATASGTSPLTYYWQFGDGGTAGPTEDPHAGHAYMDSGTYTVTLTVWNGCGSNQADFALTIPPYTIYLPIVTKLYYPGDVYEPDNSADHATLLTLGALQQHDFAPEQDVDWTYLHLTAGTTYRFETGSLAGNADTRLWLYRTGSYETPLMENDDWATGNCTGTPADPKQSCLIFTPTTTDRYEVLIDQYPAGASWGSQVRYAVGATQP